MTDAQDLPARLLALLADRCEREEPSRALDAEIAVACRIGSDKVDKDHWSYRNFPTWLPRDDGRVEAGMHWATLPYTTSLDAAVTLRPEGFAWSVAHDQTATADVNQWGEISVRGVAKTAPMAICAAALRARAAVQS